GISDPYEEPEFNNCTIDTNLLTQQECFDIIIERLNNWKS
ncbi:hypothetical protein LCGC14_2541110, partial [marine sediment metagenome]